MSSGNADGIERSEFRHTKISVQYGIPRTDKRRFKKTQIANAGFPAVLRELGLMDSQSDVAPYPIDVILRVHEALPDASS